MKGYQPKDNGNGKPKPPKKTAQDKMQLSEKEVLTCMLLIDCFMEAHHRKLKEGRIMNGIETGTYNLAHPLYFKMKKFMQRNSDNDF